MRVALVVTLLTVTGCHSAVEATSPERDASSSRPDTSVDSALGLGDAATDVALPTCHWPPAVLPPTPDGGIAVGSIARAVLYCGGVLIDGGGTTGSEWCVSNSSAVCTRMDGGGYLVGPPDEPCVMACMPTQYAVLTADPFDFGPGSPSMDADIVYPHAPAGCTGVLSTFTNAMHTGYAEQPPSVQCCPCQ